MGKPEAMWTAVLERLRKAELDKVTASFADPKHKTLCRAIDVGVEALNAETRDRYLALAVFPEDTAIHPHWLSAVWDVGQLDALDTIERLVELSLVSRDKDQYRLHDLQHDYLRAQYSEPETLALIQGAVRLSAHVISRDPAQFTGQLTGRLLGVEQASGFLASLRSGAPRPSLLPIGPALRPPGDPLLCTLEGHSNYVEAVVVTPDGKCAISASEDTTLKVWDLDSGTEIRSLVGHSDWVSAVVVTPDGQRAISASHDYTLKLWDLDSGNVIRTLEGHAIYVYAVAVTPDGKCAVSASLDLTLKLWDLESGNLIQTLAGHSIEVYAVAVTPDGQRAVSVSWDKTLRLWDLLSGECAATFTADYPIRACAVAPDGRTIVAGDNSGRVHFLELID